MFFSLLLSFLQYAILADVIASWVLQGRENGFTRILHVFTEPILVPGKKLQARLLPQLPVDISPLIALVIIEFVGTILNAILR
jgi:YggT family protein